VEAALAQLSKDSLDKVTFASVAGTLGVTKMSLYTYFPQRDALLEAMTDRAFSQLDLPAVGAGWRAYLESWLWAVVRHFERYPEVSKTIGWNGRVPAAWMRVSVPVIDTLREEGLAGDDLVLIGNWFMSSAIGLMITETMAVSYRQPSSLAAASRLDPREQETLRLMHHEWTDADRERLLALGFTKLLDSLGELLSLRRGPAVKTRRSEPRASGRTR